MLTTTDVGLVTLDGALEVYMPHEDTLPSACSAAKASAFDAMLMMIDVGLVTLDGAPVCEYCALQCFRLVSAVVRVRASPSANAIGALAGSSVPSDVGQNHSQTALRDH